MTAIYDRKALDAEAKRAARENAVRPTHVRWSVALTAEGNGCDRVALLVHYRGDDLMPKSIAVAI